MGGKALAGTNVDCSPCVPEEGKTVVVSYYATNTDATLRGVDLQFDYVSGGLAGYLGCCNLAGYVREHPVNEFEFDYGNPAALVNYAWDTAPTNGLYVKIRRIDLW